MKIFAGAESCKGAPEHFIRRLQMMRRIANRNGKLPSGRQALWYMKQDFRKTRNDKEMEEKEKFRTIKYEHDLQKAMDQWDDAILGMQNDMPQESELKWRFEVLMQDVPQLKQRWVQMKRECKREEDREPTYPEMYKEVKDHLEEKRKNKIKEYSQRQLGLRGNKENDRHQSILRQQAARETTEPPPDPWRDPAWENYKQKAEEHQVKEH